nr:MAG TPA: hypothetical protein [Caudoviricetes sp.]
MCMTNVVSLFFKVENLPYRLTICLTILSD